MIKVRYGGFWRRFWAMAIDYVFIFSIWLLFLLVMVVSGVAAVDVTGWNIDPDRLVRISGVALILHQLWCIVTWFGYFTFFHGVAGKTPGKMILGLAVYQTTGRELNLSLAFLRTAGYLFSLAFFGLGYFWVLVNPQKRAWHDFIAGTIVVRERKNALTS